MLVFYHVIIQLVVFYHVFYVHFFSGWWYINPSEKLMGFVNLVRQLGLLFPIYGKS